MKLNSQAEPAFLEQLLVLTFARGVSSGGPGRPLTGGDYHRILGNLLAEDAYHLSAVRRRQRKHAEAHLEQGQTQRPDVARHRVFGSLQADEGGILLQIWILDGHIA